MSQSNSVETLRAVCATCEKEHGITHSLEERVTHGICHRHALEFIQDSGLRPEQIQRAIKELEASDNKAPDLGPVKGKKKS